MRERSPHFHRIYIYLNTSCRYPGSQWYLLQYVYVYTSSLHPSALTDCLSLAPHVAASGSARKNLYRAGKRAFTRLHLGLPSGAYFSTSNTLLRFTACFHCGVIDFLASSFNLPFLGFLAPFNLPSWVFLRAPRQGRQWRPFWGLLHLPPRFARTHLLALKGGGYACTCRRCRRNLRIHP